MLSSKQVEIFHLLIKYRLGESALSLYELPIVESPEAAQGLQQELRSVICRIICKTI